MHAPNSRSSSSRDFTSPRMANRPRGTRVS
jgi:hypothetical protein